MNLLQYLNKSDTINQKAKFIYKNINNEYNKKLIKTKTENYYILWNSLYNLYEKVGKPMFEFIEAKSTPISNHYNKMMIDAKEDLNFLYLDTKNLNKAISSSYIDIAINRKILKNSIRYIQYKLKTLKQKVDESNNLMIFSDNFSNTSYMDISSIQKNPADIDTNNNVLSLPKINNKKINKNLFLDIQKGSNGFPGNTHEVNIIDENIYFKGEENLHIDLSEIIDNNDDTWFEYELYDINNNIYNNCSGYGFSYKEGLSWISKNDLTLNLLITNNTPCVCNFLNLKPYIINDGSYIPSVLKKINIYNGTENVLEFEINQIFNEIKSIMFEPMRVTHILLEFEQKNNYETSIGHFYYIDTLSSNNYFLDSSLDEYRRIDGDNPSLELLGMKYNPNTQQLVNAKNYTNTTYSKIINCSKIKEQLFNLNESNFECKFEIIKAKRKCIAIKDFNLGNNSYNDKGIYISKQFKCNNIITSICLETKEYIPYQFKEGDWIKYYISTDNGATWYSIVPKNKAYIPITNNEKSYYKYEINSNTPRELRNNATGYIDSILDINTIRFKIEMSKPSNNSNLNYLSPLLYEYRLIVTIGDDED